MEGPIGLGCLNGLDYLSGENGLNSLGGINGLDGLKDLIFADYLAVQHAMYSLDLQQCLKQFGLVRG